MSELTWHFESTGSRRISEDKIHVVCSEWGDRLQTLCPHVIGIDWQGPKGDSEVVTFYFF